jgi:hypothetical protein
VIAALDELLYSLERIYVIPASLEPLSRIYLYGNLPVQSTCPETPRFFASIIDSRNLALPQSGGLSETLNHHSPSKSPLIGWSIRRCSTRPLFWAASGSSVLLWGLKGIFNRRASRSFLKGTQYSNTAQLCLPALYSLLLFRYGAHQSRTDLLQEIGCTIENSILAYLLQPFFRSTVMPY